MEDFDWKTAAITAASAGIVAALFSGGFLLYSQRSTESARQDFVRVQLLAKELGEARVQLRQLAVPRSSTKELYDYSERATVEILSESEEDYYKAKEIFLRVRPLLQGRSGVIDEKYELAKSLSDRIHAEMPLESPNDVDVEQMKQIWQTAYEMVKARNQFIVTLNNEIDVAYEEALKLPQI